VLNQGVEGSGGIAPPILNLGIGWRWVVSFTPLPLYTQGKSPRYPPHRRLDGPQSRAGYYRGEKNLLPFSGAEPRFLSYTARYLVTILTKLSRILPCIVNIQQFIAVRVCIPSMPFRNSNRRWRLLFRGFQLHPLCRLSDATQLRSAKWQSAVYRHCSSKPICSQMMRYFFFQEVTSSYVRNPMWKRSIQNPSSNSTILITLSWISGYWQGQECSPFSYCALQHL
jgi:hypothetical protein